MNVFNVGSVGDLVTDLVAAIPEFPVEAGLNQLVREYQIEPGGAGNFLAAGAHLGMKMVALGAVGDDIFGRACLELLSGEGVDISQCIRQKKGSTTTVFVLVDEAGQHVFLGHYGEGPTIPFPEEWKATINKLDAVSSFGYTLQEKRLAGTMLEVLKYTHDQKVPVFFDPGPYMQTVSSDQRQLILKSSFGILMTEDEIPFMTGGAEGLAAARELLNHGPELICVKRGLHGCQIFTKDGSARHEGYDVKVVDTTGAGDTFAAAFIFAWLQKWTLEKIAAFSNAMGAAMVQKLGSGRQAPTLGEVEEIFRDFQVSK